MTLTKQQAVKDICGRLEHLSPHPELNYLFMLYQRLLGAISRPNMYYSNKNQAYLAAEALERLIQHEIFGTIDDDKHTYKYLIEEMEDWNEQD